MSLSGIIFSAVLLLIVSHPTALHAEETRIIGGEDAFPGDMRYVVAIYVNTASSRFFCGGALVNAQWILTAAQCVNEAELFTIQLGSTTLTTEDPNRVTVAASEHVIHPDFDPETLANDIGLIKLRMPVEFSDYLGPIDLPTWQLDSSIPVRAVGWGQKSEMDSGLSEHLQVVTVTSITNALCRIVYGNQITDEMLCLVGDYNEGSCIGDTGSPVMESFGRGIHVVGIASFVSGNGCESTDPSGYTRVYPYYSWITDVIGTTTN